MSTLATLFVRASVFEWEATSESSHMLGDEWQVPYSYHRHAEQLLEQKDRHSLIDSISNLKRAVDHRIKHLTSTYKTKKTPMFSETKSVLDALYKMEVVKPAMLAQLVDIRNTVEHHFGDPPNHARCQELSEFAWYFLRSTDSLTRQLSDGFGLLDTLDGCYALSYLAHPDNDWEQSVSFKLPQELVALSSEAGAMAVAPARILTRDQYIQEEAKQSKFRAELARRHLPTDVICVGRVIESADNLRLLRLYFQTM